jgi:hypothetical protein
MPSPKATFPTVETVAKPTPIPSFSAFPLETRNEIYVHLLLHDRVIDITIPHKKRGIIPAHFKQDVLDLKNFSILEVCRQTEREGTKFMYSSIRFFSKNTDTTSKLPDLLSKMGTSYMQLQYLDLNTHFLIRIHSRHF